MKTAVVTFTYNEAFNLPIWIQHYGRNFGENNLFIVDRGSDDDSLKNVGKANVIPVPRNKFDEFDKTAFISLFQNALLRFYDVVIISDCDELLVADPRFYPTLSDYVERADFDHMNAIGLEVIHVLDRELPIETDLPLLTQRRFARFQSPSCKKMISKVPLTWLNGFHSCDKEPKFDGKLFMIHTKVIDYGVSVNRQKININTEWSEKSSEAIPNSHHKYSIEHFVFQNFLTTMDLVKREQIGTLNIEEEIRNFLSLTENHNGYYYIPMDIRKMVYVPDYLASTV